MKETFSKEEKIVRDTKGDVRRDVYIPIIINDRPLMEYYSYLQYLEDHVEDIHKEFGLP